MIIKPLKKITRSEIALMNKARIKEYGKSGSRNFKKNYKDSVFFFVEDKEKIVAFGTLLPVTIEYLNRKYNIFGICNIVSIEKGKGYGKEVIHTMIKYLEKKGKTGLGFCGSQNIPFYKKAGLKTYKLLGKRFALKNPKTEKVKFEAPNDIGDGLYFEGKDRLISKMLKTKVIGTYWLPGIKNPHW
jgi:hypothetical protein